MNRTKALIGALITLGLLAAGVGGAAAEEVVRRTFAIARVVEDQGENCGFPIRWEISGTVHETRFYDDGALVRLQAHIEESNLLTNLATGTTVADEPVFNQIAVVNPDGTLQSVTTNGLFVNVRGEAGQSVMDVGRVILLVTSPTQRELIFEAGDHPFRAETLLDLRDGLSAFCEVLD